MKMKYPYAYIGVKRLFTSRILAIIGGFAMLASTFFALILNADPEYATKKEVSANDLVAMLVLVFLFASCVILVAAYVLGIVGLSKASIDEPAFRIALFTTVANIAIVGFGSMFSSMNNDFMSSLMTSISTIADLIIFIYTIQGIRSLALKLGDKDMDRRGNTLFKVLLVVIIIEFIVNVIVAIFQGANIAVAVIAAILSVAGVVLTIIQYIMFLVYLAKAKKMLANAE